MADSKKILAIVGTYRKGGVIDTAVDEVLASAKEHGAETEKIYLIDKHIEFCTNCRTCMQEPGGERGKCVLADGMESILDQVQRCDALVLGSPMNVGTATAVMKRFIERLICFGYWPWGAMAPKIRGGKPRKHAVLVVSSAAPSLLARLSSHLVKLLKTAAGLMGAKSIGVMFIGLAAQKQQQDIGDRARKKARLLGKRLATDNG